ncbi:MAG: hypothetical protein M3O70_04155 [Actinomycetota bacterium]|nr:hypothetical protein [Actinomycetota bacterium]
MTLTLPPELAGLLEQAGGHWPEADEDELHQLAGSWHTLAGNLRTLGAEGTAIARAVADEHHGESIETFSSYWQEFERNVEEGATAADETAKAVDAMAKATLGAKSAIVDGLRSAFSQVLEIRNASAALAVIGPVIGIILRVLGRFIWRILVALAKYVWRFIVWLFKKIAEIFQKIAEFFKRLWRKVTEPPKKGLPKKAPAVKPEISDPKLRNIVDDLYKGVRNQDRVGDGTTADAVRNERLTGQPTYGRWHTQKAEDSLRGMENWLRRNPDASPSDRAIAEREIANLRDALGK